MKKIFLFGINARRNVLATICFMQVLLFTYSGCSKLMDQTDFYKQLTTVIPWSAVSSVLSYTVPVVELIIATGIIFQNTRLVCMYWFCFLLIVFTVYIIVLLLEFNNLPCSCGGVISSMTWTQHLVFNIVFIVLTGTGIYLQHNINHKTNL